MMSKERELLKNTLSFLVLDWARGEKLYTQIAQLLAQPELSTDSLQLDKPVAWITEWVQRYRHNDTHIMDRAVSFTKGDAPAVPNPNYIPLYTAPQKREQEPVVWTSLRDIDWINIVNSPEILDLTNGRYDAEEAVNLAVKMTEEKCKANNSDSIPKREPMTGKEISQGFRADKDAINAESYWAGVALAEKHYGVKNET